MWRSLLGTHPAGPEQAPGTRAPQADAQHAAAPPAPQPPVIATPDDADESPSDDAAGAPDRAAPSRLPPPPRNASLAPSDRRRTPARPSHPVRSKVALAPGRSALDWARYKSTHDLRGGVRGLLRVTPSELKRHNQRSDAWTSLQGRVYNITPYLEYHPGGVPELMRAAGRDGTDLFFKTHAWVNVDALLDSAVVGVLVPDDSEDAQ